MFPTPTTKKKTGLVSPVILASRGDAVTGRLGANVVQRCTQSRFGWSEQSGSARPPAVQIQRSAETDEGERCTIWAK
jgi:hypothetical protein